MSEIIFRRFRSPFEAQLHLNGAVRFPKPYKGDEVIYGLHGLTLVFTAPAGTVTFADAAGAGLLIKDVMAQMKGDVAGLNVTLRDGVLFIADAAKTVAVSLNLAGSTAPALFGLHTTGTLTGVKYGAGAVAPRIISFSDTGVMDGFVLATEE